MTAALTFSAVPGLPAVKSGDDLGGLISSALRVADLAPQDGDVIAVTQKIVSKAEGRLRRLADVKPTPAAAELAARSCKDPRLVELILQESRAVLRVRPDLIIVEHRSGIVLANAGIDRSNISGGDDTVLLLPLDPDASAARLRDHLQNAFRVRLGVIVTDSVGRAWRKGTLGMAIGTSGVAAFRDLRGARDLHDRALQVSEIAPADSLAAAAVLLMGEAAEGTPVVLVRGYIADPHDRADQAAAAALRPAAEDLFR